LLSREINKNSEEVILTSLYKEVNRTDLSLSVRFSWINNLAYLSKPSVTKK
jgi:hypothetical protein